MLFGNASRCIWVDCLDMHGGPGVGHIRGFIFEPGKWAWILVEESEAQQFSCGVFPTRGDVLLRSVKFEARGCAMALQKHPAYQRVRCH